MRKIMRLFAWIMALVMCCTAAPAAFAAAGTPAAVKTFTMETELFSALSQKETQALRAGGLADPMTAEDLLAADPQAKLEERNGRVYMIRCENALGSVRNLREACRTAYRLFGILGASSEIVVLPWSLVTVGSLKIYTFQHVFEGNTVPGSLLKLAVREDGSVCAVFSSLSESNPESAGVKTVTAAEAEDAARKFLAEMGAEDTVIAGKTRLSALPPDLDIYAEEISPDRLVWIVFSENPFCEEGSGLKYLAHIVELNGSHHHASAVSSPEDPALRAGYTAAYTFDGLETLEWTGTLTDASGNAEEVTLPVARDPESGLYCLCDPMRKIAMAEFGEMIYAEDRDLLLVSSETNDDWEEDDLLAYRNIIRAWDYYAALGWTGTEGTGMPILMLRNMTEEDGDPIDNACYAGIIDGWQTFAYGGELGLTAALDIMAHEYTHGVTTSAMNSNLYEADYGAINEAMSDIMGNICELQSGATADTLWMLGENSGETARCMSDPHLYGQPEYVWDIFYTPSSDRPNEINDQGGVHANSSLLSLVAARLCMTEGMNLEEAASFWLTVAGVMTPLTDYKQMVSLLPWALEVSGCGRFMDKLQRLIAETRMADEEIPETLADGQRLVTLKLPEGEVFDDPYWVMMALQVDVETIKEWAGAALEAVLGAALGVGSGPEKIMALVEQTGLLNAMDEEGNIDGDRADYSLLKYMSSLFSQQMSWVSAGSDREIRAVLKQFSTVYLLFNVDPVTYDFRACAVLLGDEWTDISGILNVMTEDGSLLDLLDHLPVLLRVLRKLPKLLAKQDPEIKQLELPTAGLEGMTLPPLSRELKADAE